jgi:uncharacterized membrane protein
MRAFLSILGAFCLIMLLDLIVLGGFLLEFYNSQFTGLWRETYSGSHIVSMLFVYLLLAVGQFLFVKPHATSVKNALLYGALFGFVVYGVYELTNYILIDGWPLIIVGIDILWGMVLNAIVALGFIHKMPRK